jgi:pyridoxine kinase
LPKSSYRLLTKIQLTSRASIRSALQSLHFDHGVRHAVITSITVREDSELSDEVTKAGLRASLTTNEILGDSSVEEEYILCIASSAQNGPTNSPIVHALAVPRIKGYFSGVGDLFSALVLAHFQSALDSFNGKSVSNGIDTVSPLSQAASYALYTTQAILHRTHKHALALASKSSEASSTSANAYTDDELDAQEPLRRVRRMRTRELRIIQSRDDILACTRENSQIEAMRSWEGFWDN